MRKTLAAVLLALSISAPALAAPCGPIPALPDTVRRTEYTGIVAQTGPFPITFQLYGDGTDYQNWISVWVNGTLKVGTVDYTVAPASGPAFGTACLPITNAQVTFLAPQTGTIEIEGARRPRRASQVSENAGVTAHTFNQVISDLTATLRERWDREPRLLRAPPGETLSVLPPAASRAGALLVFDGSGNPTTAAPGVGTGNVVGPGSSVNSDVACWNGTTGALLKDCGAIGTTTLTGDVTGGPSVGTVATTLAASGVAAATYGSTSQAPQIAVDAKGRITSASNQTITSAAIGAVPTTRQVLGGSGLTAGGALSSDVTLGFNPVSDGLVLANVSGGSAAPTGNTVSAIIDHNVGSTQGQILYRNATQWVTLAPGTTGQLLTSGGAAANISWSTASGTGTVTSVNCEGLTITATGTCPQPFHVANCSLAASVATNNLTVALKDAAGNDPSASSPCVVWFRNATAATGTYSAVTVSAATSFVANSGSTFGSSSGVAFRLWVTAINNAGTLVLGVSNQSTASQIFPLNEASVQSSTACNACGTATNAGTIYSTAAQTSKALRILGYLEWGSGLGTAGVWASGPTTIQAMEPGIKKPGDIVQTTSATTTTQGTTAAAAFAVLTSNQTLAISPTSPPNLVRVTSMGALGSNTTAFSCIELFNNTNSTVIGQPTCFRNATGGNSTAPAALLGYDKPGSTSAQTYTYRGQTDAGTLSYPTVQGTGGVILELQEIMGANDNGEPLSKAG